LRRSPCYNLPSDSDCAAVFQAAARFVPQGPWTPGITVPLALQANVDEMIEYRYEFGVAVKDQT
jgi:hypothetical protein